MPFYDTLAPLNAIEYSKITQTSSEILDMTALRFGLRHVGSIRTCTCLLEPKSRRQQTREVPIGVAFPNNWCLIRLTYLMREQNPTELTFNEAA
jgi:hypothetical protein